MFFQRESVAVVLACWFFGFVLSTNQAPEKVTDWPQFRGPTRQGVSTDTGLPVTWTSTKNVLWRADLPGSGSSSPIVVGDRVFVTCYMGYGVPREVGDMDELLYRLCCFWAKDGSLLWAVDIEPDLPEQGSIRELHGYASSTPASDGKWLYTFFGKSGVFAFNQYGRRRWHKEVGSKTDAWGSATSPLLFADLVIVNASVESECLVALDKKSGKFRWRFAGIKDSWNSPILVDVGGGKQELVVAIRNYIIGVDPATGEHLWTCGTDIGWAMVPSLVVHDGIVYCVGGQSGGGMAVRAGGRGNVTESHRLWTMHKGSNVTSPVVHDGHLYWMHENLGIAYCAETTTGKLVYEQRINGADQVFASPVVADGKLYYLTRTGLTFVLGAKPKYELLASNNLKDRDYFNASPAIAGGRLFLRSEKSLYCISTR